MSQNNIAGQSLPPIGRAIFDDWPVADEIHLNVWRSLSDFTRMEDTGRPPTIIPGFEEICVRSYPVGRWVTDREEFGGDAGIIVGGRYTDRHMRESFTLYRKPEFKRLAAEYRAARAASKPFRDDPEKRIENAIADALRNIGHCVRQQVTCSTGIADIIDDTSKTIIECKASDKEYVVLSALSQVHRYQLVFVDYRTALGLPNKIGGWVERVTSSAGIGIFSPGCDVQAVLRSMDEFYDRRK